MTEIFINTIAKPHVVSLSNDRPNTILKQTGHLIENAFNHSYTYLSFIVSMHFPFQITNDILFTNVLEIVLNSILPSLSATINQKHSQQSHNSSKQRIKQSYFKSAEVVSQGSATYGPRPNRVHEAISCGPLTFMLIRPATFFYN